MEAVQACDKYNERVEAILGRSRLGEGFVACASLSTAALVAALPLPLELHAGALAWTAAAVLLALRRLRPGVRIQVDHAGELTVDGAPGALRDGSFVAPWLAILRWRPPGAHFDRTLLVAPDMLDAESFRRLRVILRFGVRPLGPLFPSGERTKGTGLPRR